MVTDRGNEDGRLNNQLNEDFAALTTTIVPIQEKEEKKVEEKKEEKKQDIENEEKTIEISSHANEAGRSRFASACNRLENIKLNNELLEKVKGLLEK
ncbi:Hypothetical predicted protein [Octopus vulgaris]|uniref:Uncharacterized protein n=1 Tax=Octopus vulgaris TaxID=6645 RepID=A0AA36F3K7_OCTVU|nr:Hypothetical predicted protein [Octopus vulgaris]